VQSVERALGLLLAFEHSPSQTAAELARNTGLTRPTTYRLLHTLQELGFVRNTGGCFEVTPQVMRLSAGFVARQGIARHASRVVESLAAATGEHTAVAVLDGDEVVTIAAANARSSRYLAVAVQVGQRLPAKETSLGRVLLAHTSTPAAAQLDAADRDQIVGAGYATADGILESGLRSIGVPIRNHREEVIAAMSIATSAHSRSLEALETEILPRLLEAAAELSNAT
jgi:IclR family pca regulon transcriptional regulator